METRIERRGEDLYIYPGRRRFGMLALGALAFVTLAAALVAVVGLAMLALAAVAVPFFGLIFLWTAYRLAVPRPLLVMGPKGMRDTSSLLAAGFLR